LLLRSWNHNFCSSRAISYFTSTTTRNRRGCASGDSGNRLRIGPKRWGYVGLLLCLKAQTLGDLYQNSAARARNHKQEINPNSYIITPGASQFDPHSQPAKSLTRSPSVSCCIDWPTDPPARPPTQGCARAGADWARHPATPHIPPLPGRVPPPPPRAIPFAAVAPSTRCVFTTRLPVLLSPSLPPSGFLWVCFALDKIGFGLTGSPLRRFALSFLLACGAHGSMEWLLSLSVRFSAPQMRRGLVHRRFDYIDLKSNLNVSSSFPFGGVMLCNSGR
jgi:hypothetical protein